MFQSANTREFRVPLSRLSADLVHFFSALLHCSYSSSLAGTSWIVAWLVVAVSGLIRIVSPHDIVDSKVITYVATLRGVIVARLHSGHAQLSEGILL